MKSNYLKRIGANLLAHPSRRKPRQHRKLCIYKADRLGDFVLALGAIRLLVNETGADKCVLIASQYGNELAELEFPNVTKIKVSAFGGMRYGEPFASWMFVRPLLSEYFFDYMICLRHQRLSFQSLVLSWVKAPKRYGITPKNINDIERTFQCPLFTEDCVYPEIEPSGICGEIEAHRLLLSKLFGRTVTATEILPSFSHHYKKNSEYLLLTPFASTTLKEYSTTQVAAVVSYFFKKFRQMPVRISCGPGQQQRAEDFIHAIKSGCDIQIGLLNTPSVESFIQAVSNAAGILTVDSACAHIAAALDKPTVVLLGGGHYGQFGPWSRSPRQRWLTSKKSCFQCDWKCSTAEYAPCISEISPFEIAEKLMEVMLY